MKKILLGLGLLAALLIPGFAAAQEFQPLPSVTTSGVTDTTLSLSVPIQPLGTMMKLAGPDSSGYKEFRYVRYWCNPTDTVQVGDVLYDTTTASSSAWNVTLLSPTFNDSIGLNDSTVYLRVGAATVCGVSDGVHLRGEYGWLQVRGLTEINLNPTLLQKAVSAGYANRFYRSGMGICGSLPGTKHWASIVALTKPTTTDSKQLLLINTRFGHVAFANPVDTTKVMAYIRTLY